MYYLLGVGAVMAYGWRQVFIGQREKHEMAREKMWARIHLIPLLQAEEDRDQVRRYYADLAREKELLGSQSGPYNSDRYVFFLSEQEVHREQEDQEEEEEEGRAEKYAVPTRGGRPLAIAKGEESDSTQERRPANRTMNPLQIRETDIRRHAQPDDGMTRRRESPPGIIKKKKLKSTPPCSPILQLFQTRHLQFPPVSTPPSGTSRNVTAGNENTDCSLAFL